MTTVLQGSARTGSRTVTTAAVGQRVGGLGFGDGDGLDGDGVGAELLGADRATT